MANPATDPALSLLPPMPTAPQYGRFVHHEMLDPRKHGPGLWEALGQEKLNAMTTYLYWPRIESSDHLVAHLAQITKREGHRSLLARLKRRPVTSNVCAILRADTGEVMGMRCYTAPDPRHRTVETGPMIKGAAMSRSVYSTESAYLSASRAFEWGCRRYEARCNADNEAGKYSTLRIGFKEEGTFRNHRIFNGESQHTVWYSITLEEWPIIKRSLELFLHADNLGPDLKAKRRLKDIRDELLANAQAGHDRA